MSNQGDPNDQVRSARERDLGDQGAKHNRRQGTDRDGNEEGRTVDFKVVEPRLCSEQDDSVGHQCNDGSNDHLKYGIALFGRSGHR